MASSMRSAATQSVVSWRTSRRMHFPRIGGRRGRHCRLNAWDSAREWSNGIHAVGGEAEWTTLSAYDPATDRWTTKAPMPTGRSNLGVAVVNGVLYAIGGNGPSLVPLATVEAYDPMTNTWTSKAPMPTVRWGLEVAVVNGVIYAIGGAFSGTMVEAYDPSSDSCDDQGTNADVPSTIRRWSSERRDYAVGGAGGPGPQSVVEAYDPLTNSWSTHASMPTARYGVRGGSGEQHSLCRRGHC